MIADLSRQTFYESFAAQNSAENMQKFLDEQFTRQALINEVVTIGNIFLLAYDGTEVVGYARLRENNNPPELGNIQAIELARIYAVKNAIGKGVGSKLMEASIDIARDRKKQMLWLGVWEHNPRAIEFYTKWGFEKFSEHDFILGDDVQRDWLMKREVR